MKTGLLALSICLAACSGGISTDQACTDWAGARCQKLMSCTGGTGITHNWGDLSTCMIREKLDCLNRLGAPDQTNTPDHTEACAMAIPGQSCTDYFAAVPFAACMAKQGPRADGGRCIAGGQCQNNHCLYNPGDACGTCMPDPQVGDTCAPGDCGSNYCVAEVFTCQVPVDAGSMCGKDRYCSPELSCTGLSATNSGTCQKSLSIEGTTCDPQQQNTPACDGWMGLYCHAVTQQCTLYTYAGQGMPCGLLADGSRALCRGGGLCVISQGQTAGTCKLPAVDGRACDIVNGPPCLFPARCSVRGQTTTAGICTIPDATQCT